MLNLIPSLFDTGAFSLLSSSSVFLFVRFVLLVCFVLFHFESFAFSFQERGKENVGYKVSIYHLSSSTQRSISLIHTQPARIISLSVPK